MSWQPTASIETLRARARLLADIRAFFAVRDVLEVTTPALSPFGATDPNIGSLGAQSRTLPALRQAWLHTSPEFAMKRLLAAGSGPIYQLCTVFRDSDSGRYHRPEFSMLEWYRPRWTDGQLMDEVEALVIAVAAPYRALPRARRVSYRQLFINSLDIDPATADVADCRACCVRHDLSPPDSMGDALDPWLDLLMSMLIAPRFPANELVFVHDYPASQAALARLRTVDGYSVAARFELYWGSLELVNGYHELTDAAEQLARFNKDNETRQRAGLPVIPIDKRLIDAMHAGLPECAGVALGVDRLLMAMLGINDIRRVIGFADDFEEGM